MTKEELSELLFFEDIHERMQSSYPNSPMWDDFEAMKWRLPYLRGKKEGWEQGRKAYRKQLMARIRESQNRRWKKIQELE